MKTKFDDFNENKVEKIRCKKTFTTYMNAKNLIFNGYSEEEALKYGKVGFPIFVEGEEYTFCGPMETLSDNPIIYVDSKLKLRNPDYGVKFIHELFYVDEYNEKDVKNWEEKMNKYKDTSMWDMVKKSTKKPKNDPYIGDYFDIK